MHLTTTISANKHLLQSHTTWPHMTRDAGTKSVPKPTRRRLAWSSGNGYLLSSSISPLKYKNTKKIEVVRTGPIQKEN
jgi:hypothetical protein